MIPTKYIAGPIIIAVVAFIIHEFYQQAKLSAARRKKLQQIQDAKLSLELAKYEQEKKE